MNQDKRIEHDVCDEILVTTNNRAYVCDIYREKYNRRIVQYARMRKVSVGVEVYERCDVDVDEVKGPS